MSFVHTHGEAPAIARSHSDALTRVTRVLTTLVVLALVVTLVVAVRVFVYEYFHGDQQPLQNLFWLIADLLNL